MPKLACPCGYVHDLSPVPDAGWVTVRDRDFERLVELECADEARPGATLPLQGRLYGCPLCGRLMWRREGATAYDVWAPTTPRTVGDVSDDTARADRLHALVATLVEQQGERLTAQLLAAPAGAWRPVRELCAGFLEAPRDLDDWLRALLAMWSPLPGDRPDTRERAALITFLHTSSLWSEQLLHFGSVDGRRRASAT